jgi:hypothetical protein
LRGGNTGKRHLSIISALDKMFHFVQYHKSTFNKDGALSAYLDIITLDKMMKDRKHLVSAFDVQEKDGKEREIGVSPATYSRRGLTYDIFRFVS